MNQLSTTIVPLKLNQYFLPLFLVLIIIYCYPNNHCSRNRNCKTNSPLLTHQYVLTTSTNNKINLKFTTKFRLVVYFFQYPHNHNIYFNDKLTIVKVQEEQFYLTKIKKYILWIQIFINFPQNVLCKKKHNNMNFQNYILANISKNQYTEKFICCQYMIYQHQFPQELQPITQIKQKQYCCQYMEKNFSP
eukprot:TRINITY_DN5283_c0_g1_i13.p1 TRINITY_DN5283_c0_g1~~TRINITY_DN5283_c0_g1_i13.p1  ORF type:complete len:190 (+),score=-25.70 TRINITY_DN5283_c0_g1_i13:252-821(+)